MFRFLLLLALCSSPLLALAQTSPPKAASNLRDGAYRQKGMIMRLKGGQASRLQGSLTLNDGSVLKPNGLLIRKDGTRQMLPEGQAVNMQGVVVTLRDDMRSVNAIEQHHQEVIGSTSETRFEIPITPAAPATVQQLQALERRVALLQQLSDKLADRTAQATSSVPKADQYDAQLRSIDSKLRR